MCLGKVQTLWAKIGRSGRQSYGYDLLRQGWSAAFGVFIVNRLSGNGIAARQPSTQIHIRAPPRAKGAIFGLCLGGTGLAGTNWADHI